MAELERAAISKRLGESRRNAGLTQQQIADLLHVHKRSTEDWESPRKHVVPFDRLGEWAQLTGVSREWLLYGDESTATDDQVAELRREVREVLERVTRIEERLLDAPSASPPARRGTSRARPTPE